MGFTTLSNQEEWIIVEEVITEDFDRHMGVWLLFHWHTRLNVLKSAETHLKKVALLLTEKSTKENNRTPNLRDGDKKR